MRLGVCNLRRTARYTAPTPLFNSVWWIARPRTVSALKTPHTSPPCHPFVGVSSVIFPILFFSLPLYGGATHQLAELPDVCFGSKADIQPFSQCPLYPQKRTLVPRVGVPALCQKQTSAELVDHVVRAGEQRWRDNETERFGGLQVDDHLVLGRRLHWQVGRLLAFEDAIDIAGCAPIPLGKISSVRD